MRFPTAVTLLALLALQRPTIADPPAAAPIAATIRRVAGLVPLDEDAIETVLPSGREDTQEREYSPEAQGAIVRLKRQVRELSLERLRSGLGEPEALRSAILQSLLQGGVLLGQRTFGGIDAVEVKSVDGHPDLLAVVTTLGIGCGEDSSLALFERKEGAWRLALVLQAEPYEEIGGAFGRFEYHVSAPAGDGSWFVVAAWVSPWCTSSWQTIFTRVIRVGPDPLEPHVFADLQGTIYLGRDPAYELTATRTGFDLRFVAEQSLDPGRLVRNHRLAFLVEGDSVRRVEPLADRAQDFLDEWLALPWTEAMAHAVASSRDSLPAWHELLSDARARFATEIAFERRLRPGPGIPSEHAGLERWQVGLNLGPPVEGRGPAVEHGTVFVTIRRIGDRYEVESVTEEPDGLPSDEQEAQGAEPEGREPVEGA